MGDTYGGDVGAAYFAHFDSSKQIDSLIIDVFCLFTDYELSHQPRKIKIADEPMNTTESKNFTKKLIIEYLDNPYEYIY